MTDNLQNSISTLKGIGPKKEALFNRLAIFTLRDLISYYPFRYEDRTAVTPISAAQDGQRSSFIAFVIDTPKLSRIRKGLDLIHFRIADDSGIAHVTIFNQSYLKNSIVLNGHYSFYGQVEKKGNSISIVNPVMEQIGEDASFSGKIVPIYRLTSGLNRKAVSDAVCNAISLCSDEFTEVIPYDIRERCGLADISFAYRSIHSPADFDSLACASKRLAFEDIFTLSCAMEMRHNARSKSEGPVISPSYLDEFLTLFSFAPTNAQMRSIKECLEDMGSGYSMNRLLQGDVGSGKTLVAAALMYCTCKSGYVSALMAPTEILARQHYNTLSELFRSTGLRLSLLTGDCSTSEKRMIKAALAAGDIDVIIGTHALLSDDVEYNRLALIITDEQHRFGVKQRSTLIQKGENPHTFVMSATPIPRTLALIIYGDLDVSVLDELPPGRQKVDTFLVNESYRERVNAFITKNVTAGNQVYVVCPKVENEESDEIPADISELKSAEDYSRSLAEHFPMFKVGCVHGRLSAADKATVMDSFCKGNLDILVSTTVIEVGVDVPNACLMIIENAERFGLSQLHQLRGRVGRGGTKSYCILISNSSSEDSVNRLKVLCSTNNGFEIAEQDLKMRGPGDFLGVRQHGLPEIKAACVCTDINLLNLAKAEAVSLVENDPDLSLPEHAALKIRVSSILDVSASALN